MIETIASQMGWFVWATGAGLVVVAMTARYALFAGGALALTKMFDKHLAARRIQKQAFQNAQLIRELSWSLVTIVIFAGLAAVAIATRGMIGPPGLYTDIDQHGWLWFALSVPIALLLHDAYFYWTHRLLHHPRVMSLWHAVHHKSHNPSPLAALAFHPVEALVNAMGVIVIFTVLPMHIAALAAFGVLSFAFNVLGHLGYELYPQWLMTSAAGRWLNSATSHNLHHRAYKYQFGLYTLIWDRLCGTLHPHYDAMRLKAGAAPSVNANALTTEVL